MDDQDLGQGQGFEQVDADAVCEKCSTVNDEGALLCKVCGNNLRDQRAQRIGSIGTPEMLDAGQSKIRMLTGLLVVMGILAVLYAAMNIGSFEAYLTSRLSDDPLANIDDYWGGPEAPLYESMLQDILTNPTPEGARIASLADPQIETSFSGRYLILESGAVSTERIVAEAQLTRYGSRILFVCVSQNGELDVRGYGYFSPRMGVVAASVIARETAEMRTGGNVEVVLGLSSPMEVGGHTVMARQLQNEAPREFLAYRVRSDF